MAATTLRAGGHRLEYRWIGPAPDQAATIVFLHEGLGSVSMWRDFPDLLAAATGLGVLVYSRYGHGGSDRLAEPRALDYMHREAFVVLPEVLDALGVAEAILVGHSDGGSIALLNAGSAHSRARALVLEAAHVFVEDLSVTSIAEAGRLYREGDLAARLARHHGDNTDAMFRGWNDIWLDPAFRHWNIEGCLPDVGCPVLVIQGEDDEYGTLRQVEAIREQVAGPVATHVLARCRHAPHRDQTARTLDIMGAFIAALGEGGQG